MNPRITWLLMGIGSGLVVGGGLRLVIELLPPLLARYINTTSDRELLATALLLILVGLPVIAGTLLVTRRLARPFLADIRAQGPTRPALQSRQPQPRWFALHLGTVAAAAGISVAVLSGPVAAVIASGCGVAIRLAVTYAVALTSH